MGKEKPGFLTAKAISNRIKSKGLQKLRWFCQMCQKQCRDENGFKCHINSESHHRQMLLFDENSSHFLGNYTRVFMKGYLDVLRRQFGGKRTQANVVYQEYIKDKEHVHMNSTKFTTLTGFINCLHKMGICRVDQTDKGWFIEYIAKDPEQEHLDRKKRKLNQTLAEDDEQFFEIIEKNLSKKPKTEHEKVIFESIELVKNEDDKIAFNFMKSDFKVAKEKKEKLPEIEEKIELIFSTNDMKSSVIPQKIFLEEPELDKKFRSSSRPSTSKIDKQENVKQFPSKKLSILEEMRVEQELDKDRRSRTRYWLHEGIVVRLVDDNLPDQLINRLAHVVQVEDRYKAVVKTIDVADGANKKLRVQQEHVLTVVPRVGERVLIVNGAYRDCRGTVLRIDKQKFTAEIELISGIHTGMKLSSISYDDFSKLFDQN